MSWSPEILEIQKKSPKTSERAESIPRGYCTFVPFSTMIVPTFLPPIESRLRRAPVRAIWALMRIVKATPFRRLPLSRVLSSTCERWSEIVNEHGIILLEVHCQDPLVVREHIDQSESLYFDAIEGFSQQLLIEADVALMAAAEAGLFPSRNYFRKFPRFFPYCRITLNLFERRPYRVRLARTSDLPSLLRLEEACWPEDMRVAGDELRRRIETYALGQWVVEMDGEIVGVVYSQRIADVEQLRQCKFADRRRTERRKWKLSCSFWG